MRSTRGITLKAIVPGGLLVALFITTPSFGGSDFPATGQTTSFRPGDDGAIQAGAPFEFEDNGDGTITDENTHLMWEKNSADGSIHDKDTFYTWDDAFDVHVATLNRTHFAGHRDWRVPNVKELQSIVNWGNSFPVPAVSPAFDTNCAAGCTVRTCSCTGSTYAYWSSTTDATTPTLAWVVFFSDGATGSQHKDVDEEAGDFARGVVRAVRGGLAPGRSPRPPSSASDALDDQQR